MAEKRELEIVARVRDRVSKTAKQIGERLSAAFKNPAQLSKLLGQRVKNTNGAIRAHLQKLEEVRDGLDRSSRGYKRASKEIRKYERRMNGSTSVMNKFRLGVAGLVAVMGALGARAGAQAFGGVVESVDRLGKIAPTMNDTVENISRMEFAMKLAGIEGSNLEAIMTGLARKTSQALNGNKGQIEAFERLGISIDDLKKKGAKELFGSMTESLEKYGTTAEKSAALQVIFEDNFRKLNGLIGQGKKNFDDLTSSADKYGAAISQADADAAAKMADAMLKVETAVVSVVRVFVTQWSPYIVPIMEEFAELLVKNTATFARFAKTIGSGLLKIADAAATALVGMVRLAEFFNLIESGESRSERLVRLHASLTDVTDAILDVTKAQKAAEQEGRSQARYLDELNGLYARAAELREKIQRGEQVPGRLSESLADSLSKIRRSLKDLDKVGEDSDGAENLFKRIGDAAKIAGDNIQGTEAQLDGLTVFLNATGESLGKVIDRWSDLTRAGQQTGQLLDSALGGLANTLGAIVSGTERASAAFKSFFAQLARQLANRAIANIITSIIGAFASSYGASGGGNGYTDGGGGYVWGNGGFGDGSYSTNSAGGGSIGGGKSIDVGFSPRPGPVSSGGNTYITNNYYTTNIDALDTQSIEKALVENRKTIWAIGEHGVSGGSHSFKQAMRGTK